MSNSLWPYVDYNILAWNSYQLASSSGLPLDLPCREKPGQHSQPPPIFHLLVIKVTMYHNYVSPSSLPWGPGGALPSPHLHSVLYLPLASSQGHFEPCHCLYVLAIIPRCEGWISFKALSFSRCMVCRNYIHTNILYGIRIGIPLIGQQQ